MSTSLDPFFSLICTLDDPALSVACPQCKSESGMPCVTSKGMADSHHKPRRLAFLANYVTKCQVPLDQSDS